MTPFVTIIIPSFNRGDTLARAVGSILQQSYANFELIVVDDGSTDNTENVMESLRHPKLVYERLEKNHGACYARNHGISLARGELIAFQDSDDYWKPDKLDKQIRFMQDGNYDFVYCAMEMNDIRGQRIIIPQNHDSIPEYAPCAQTYQALLRGSTCSTQTILCKREVAEATRFDSDLPRLQDWDFVLRLSRQYRIGFQNEILVEQYIQKNSISSKPYLLFQALEELQSKYSDDIAKDKAAKQYFDAKLASSAFYAGFPCVKRCFKVFFHATQMEIYHLRTISNDRAARFVHQKENAASIGSIICLLNERKKSSRRIGGAEVAHQCGCACI